MNNTLHTLKELNYPQLHNGYEVATDITFTVENGIVVGKETVDMVDERITTASTTSTTKATETTTTTKAPINIRRSNTWPKLFFFLLFLSITKLFVFNVIFK